MTVLRSDVGLRSERGPILLAIMVSTGIVAIDSTIIATAVPSIVKDLGGFSAFPWLFSIYLLTQAVTVPIYAKLADTFGRKPVILFGIGLFLLGSILCGFAWSMPALIAFRAVQGLGAGAVQPMSITIVGDIYTVAERAKTQGYLAGVWAVSSVIGPTLGGVFATYLSWQWIFFVNVPLCVLAGFLLIRNFHEKIEKTAHRIDFAGAALLTVAVTLLLLGILEGGVAWPWASPISIAIFAVGILVLAAFALVERRAAEPVLPTWVFSRRLLLTTSLVALGVGGILVGLSSYVPTYLQYSLGVAALPAGLTLAALTIGWPIAATLSGRFYLRIGFRSTALIGVTLLIVGAGVLALFARTPSIPVVAIACFLMGLGLGLSNAPTLIAAQSSVAWNERGVATGTNMFSRSIGSAVGAAVFGAIANGIIASRGGNEADPATITAAGSAVFFAVVVASALTILAAASMPKTPVVRAVAAPPATDLEVATD